LENLKSYFGWQFTSDARHFVEEGLELLVRNVLGAVSVEVLDEVQVVEDALAAREDAEAPVQKIFKCVSSNKKFLTEKNLDM
jgi:hypothetical protein